MCKFERQPQLNLHIAKAYLAGTDSGVSTRTWQHALEAIVQSKEGSTKERWERAANEPAIDTLRDRVIIETQAEHLLACLKVGTVSTNVHLRKIHNFCLAMNWLPWPLIPKHLWPAIRFQPKRAITFEEHQAIIGRERNPELRDFYDLCWHLGGSQSDIASLRAEDIDWNDRVIAYARKKTGSLAQIHFGEAVEAILRLRPSEGPLFPRLLKMHEKHRAKEFKRRCVGLSIQGVTLHSYRYAWAERAKECGYAEKHVLAFVGGKLTEASAIFWKIAAFTPPRFDLDATTFCIYRIESLRSRIFHHFQVQRSTNKYFANFSRNTKLTTTVGRTLVKEFRSDHAGHSLDDSIGNRKSFNFSRFHGDGKRNVPTSFKPLPTLLWRQSRHLKHLKPFARFRKIFPRPGSHHPL